MYVTSPGWLKGHIMIMIIMVMVIFFSNIKYDDMQYIQNRSVAQKEMLRYLRSPKWKLLNDIQQAEVHSQGQDDVDASE